MPYKTGKCSLTVNQHLVYIPFNRFNGYTASSVVSQSCQFFVAFISFFTVKLTASTIN